jgi:hypothetical protein
VTTTIEVPDVVVAGGYLYRPQPSYFDDEAVQQQIFGELLGNDTLRRLDAFTQCALFAVEHARRAAGVTTPSTIAPTERHGVCVGTGLGAQATRVRYSKRLARLGPSATNPIDFPDSIDGAAAAHVAMRWGLRGPSLTFVDGSGTAENAILAACRQIALGRADRMYLVVGDIYEPWLRRNIGETVGSSDTTRNATGDAPPPGPVDAVLALVLESLDRSRHADDQTRVIGFLNTPANSADNCLTRDLMPPESDHFDFSGVLQAGGAWLEAIAPMGNAVRSCQDGPVFGLRSRVNPATQSRLAFWRRVNK